MLYFSAVLVVLLMSTALPAVADPAEPTNYESTVLDVQPATSDVTFEVIGGDAFISATVAPGHELIVPGYFGEPYLRMTADGTVFANQNSRALYINQDRYADVTVPDGFQDGADPDWIEVGEGGTYAWHDHRTHWMSKDLPPSISGSETETIFPWQISVVLDGEEIVVTGELTWLPSRSPLPAVMAGMLGLVPLILGGQVRKKAIRWLSFLAAAVALLVVATEWINTPTGARGAPLEAAFPIMALIAFSAPRWTPGLSALLSRITDLIGWSVLAVWIVTAANRLWLPVLISGLPPVIERFSVAFVIWASVSGLAVSLHALRYQR